MADNELPIADIAIIGSGIACSSTLIALFEKLLSSGQTKSPFTITVIERYTEFWKGIPYGNRSSVNALTITTLHDFFTCDDERVSFFKWFIPNQSKILRNYAAIGGTAAAGWLRDNKQALDDKDWKNIYLPRFIIGDYTLQRLNNLREQVENKGLAKIITVQGNAIAVKQHETLKSVMVHAAGVEISIRAKKIVLAIGSAPERKLITAFDNQAGVLYINNLHEKNLEDTIETIRSGLNMAGPKDRNILILGSNAGSIELLYLLNNTDKLSAAINGITLLSPGGRLPGHITYTNYGHQVKAHLDELSQKTNYTLQELVEAATRDLLKISIDRVSVPDLAIIMAQVIRLLQPLNDESKKIFYGIYGIQLARIFRRSGTDYKKASAFLSQNNKLTLLKGSFLHLKYNDDGSTSLTYHQADQSIAQITKKFQVVVNCTGSDDLHNTSSPLIQDLIKNNGFKVNHSRKAFEVADNLQAAPGIFVIGPLAGGNFNKLLYFWHLENASRIIYLSKYLVNELVR